MQTFNDSDTPRPETVASDFPGDTLATAAPPFYPFDPDTAAFAAAFYQLTPEYQGYLRAAVEAFAAIESGEPVDLDAFRAAVPLMDATAEVHARVTAHCEQREGGRKV